MLPLQVMDFNGDRLNDVVLVARDGIYAWAQVRTAPHTCGSSGRMRARHQGISLWCSPPNRRPGLAWVVRSLSSWISDLSFPASSRDSTVERACLLRLALHQRWSVKARQCKHTLP